MEGFRPKFIIFLVLAGLISTPSFSETNVCAWSCGKVSSADAVNEQLKNILNQIELFRSKKTKCPLNDGFDHTDSAGKLRLGAFQALAIDRRNCDVSGISNHGHSDFLYRLLSVQGLRLSASRSVVKAKEASPRNILKNFSKMDCLSEFTDDQLFLPGDILVGQSEAVVIDAVQADPFNIAKKILDHKKDLEHAADFKNVPSYSEMSEVAKKICTDWMKDPSEFKISILYYRGKAPLFPTMGLSSTSWEARVTERAKNACRKRVESEIAGMAKVKPADFEPERSAEGIEPGVRFFRHSSSLSCRNSGSEMHAVPDLDCVQCCDFSKQGVQ